MADPVLDYFVADTPAAPRRAANQPTKSGVDAFMDAFFGQTDQEPPAPGRGLSGVFSTGQPVIDPKASPKNIGRDLIEAGRTLYRGVTTPTTAGRDLYARYPWLRWTPIPGAMDVMERFGAIPRAIGQLGPEKAQPLTEALASGAMGAGPRAFARPFSALTRGHLPAPSSLLRNPAAEAAAATFAEGEQATAARIAEHLARLRARAATPALEGGQRALPPRTSASVSPVYEVERSPIAQPPVPTPRTGYQAERALPVKGEPLEGELLDQFGRPVRAGDMTQTERDRLRRLYHGRMEDRPDLTGPRSTEQPFGQPRPWEPQEAPAPPPAGEPAPPGPSTPPSRHSAPQARDLGVFGDLGMTAEDLVSVGKPPAAPLRFERTPTGEQAMIPGAEARAMPSTVLRTRTAQQPTSETPLFQPAETARQATLEEAPRARGQHYGSTVDTGTVSLSDPEEVRIMLRDRGGLDPASYGVDRSVVPRDLLKPGGAKWDEVVQELADAQGRRPKDVERQLTDTLGRLTSHKAGVQRLEGLQEVRGGKPPADIPIELGEWQTMGPAQRRSALDFFRAELNDESGRLDLEAMAKTWKRFRQRFPMEEAVRHARPNSPVISEVERWSTGMADGLQHVVTQPWWKGARKVNPELLKDVEETAVSEWIAAGRTPQAAKAARRHFPPEIQEAMRHRDRQFQLENQSRTYFGLDPIPENQGPYLPRRVDPESRQAVSLGADQLGGRGHGLQTTVRGHQQERVFETYRAGERTGLEYEDPRNSLLMREWQGLKLRATHRLFRNLESKGTLFRDEVSARAASPTGQPWRIENAPGGTWWATTEQEAKFLRQNLTEAQRGPTGSFVSYGNALLRNPNLINPAPHVVKNMAMKALLARGPIAPYTLARDAVEWARSANPTLLREFNEAMPFSQTGHVAQEILGRELRSGPVGDTIRGALRTLGMVNRPSQRVIFEWADPAMRYSMYKHYRQQGMGVYEAGNHAWVDLIRYGTRSQATDFWKSIPLNFFVPWRYGTFVSLVKQVQNHPIRTALLLGAVDYLREARYRATGRWTHLPFDYVEKPLVTLLESRRPEDVMSVLGTTAVFGPGGDFGAKQLTEAVDAVRGKPHSFEWDRLKNAFWGISQLYGPGGAADEFKKGQYGDMMAGLLLGEHRALSYQPRRFGRLLPESLPGMQRSPLVQEAERRQAVQRAKTEKADERRQTKPRRSIEDRLREAGYLH